MTLAFFGPIGPPELIVLALLGLLIFGRRLPEIGRSLGKGIVEFKKGLAGVDEEVNKNSLPPAPQNPAQLNAPATSDQELAQARDDVRALKQRLDAIEKKTT